MRQPFAIDLVVWLVLRGGGGSSRRCRLTRRRGGGPAGVRAQAPTGTMIFRGKAAYALVGWERCGVVTGHRPSANYLPSPQPAELMPVRISIGTLLFTRSGIGITAPPRSPDVIVSIRTPSHPILCLPTKGVVTLIHGVG